MPAASELTRRRPASRRDARRAEIAEVFGHFGVVSGHPARSKRGAAGRAAAVDYARTVPARGNVAAFAEGLNALGPVFQSFALHLGTRPDLLTAPDRDLFAAFVPRSAPLSAAAARLLLDRELGESAARIGAIAEEPVAETALWQERRALLAPDAPEAAIFAESAADGSAAIRVRLLRPEAEDALITDLEALPQLAGLRITGADGRTVDLDDAIADFLDELPREVDLREHASRLPTSGALAARVRAVAVLPTLTTRGVLTYAEPAPNPLAVSADTDGTLLLCRAWLALALGDGLVWVDPSPAVAGLDRDGTLVVSGGRFDRASEDFRSDLERYLIAAANEEPDLCRTLLERHSTHGPGYDPARLATALRQLVPFRDHGLPGVRPVPVLADSYFLQWRLARREGLRADAALLAAWRGMASLDRAQRLLEPGRVQPAAAGDPLDAMAGPSRRARAAGEAVRDPLQRALRRHRLHRAGREAARLARPGEWRASFSRAVPALLELMERVQEEDLRRPRRGDRHD